MINLIRKKTSTTYPCLVLLLLILGSCKKEKKQEPVKETGTVTDVQGNVYPTIKIGNQWWMMENLRVTVYNDSTPITEVKPSDKDTAWSNKLTGAFCSIDYRYGIHYNWYTLVNPKKLAPKGWHIPSDEEWKMMEMEIGMSQEEADKTAWRGSNESEKMIPEASVGWPISTVFGTNESGFNALPGGCRLFNGSVGDVSGAGYWWCVSEKGSTAWYRNLTPGHKTVFRYYADKNYGFNVRCVKD